MASATAIPLEPPPVDSPQRAAVMSALQRLLASPDFKASPRQRRLLVYLIEETLAGRAERLKAYNIATSVLGRSERFDPQADPVVRVETSSLRQCLARYYLTEGRGLDFRINIPKGCYVPSFESGPGDRPQTTAAVPAGKRTDRTVQWLWARPLVVAVFVLLIVASGPVGTRHTGGILGAASRPDMDGRPAVLVAGIINDSDDPALGAFAGAMTADVISALARFTDLQVFTAAISGGSNPPRVEYRLDGIVTRLAEDAQVSMTLREMRSGYAVWRRSYTARPDASDGAIVRQVAQTVGDPYGVIATLETKSLAGLAEPARAVRRCVLAFHAYMETGGATRHGDVRACLEDGVRAAPHYSSLWADLALVYVDEYRYGYNELGSGGPPLDRAFAAASRAVALDRTNAWAHAVLAISDWFKGDHNAFATEADKALTLNPNDTLALGEIGTRRFVGGDRAGGLALVHRALDHGSGRPATYRYIYALDAYIRGDYAAALDEIQRAGDAWAPAKALLLSATYGRLGRPDDARAAWAQLTAQTPNIAKAPRNTLLDRGWSPEIVNSVMDGLADASLVHRAASGS